LGFKHVNFTSTLQLFYLVETTFPCAYVKVIEDISERKWAIKRN